ncbi:MAG TPA: metalloregulator ArsR/SmtB family transcription factor [Candidatus Limiplasma sp.]|nr:metalloregulator ArsR/SmtB family transcription factor [Candidatus Limiplasma sp.]
MTEYAADARMFKAFCDENRLKIIALLQNGELCACQLIPKLNMSQSTLSYHMKILCDSGIVINRQEGKWAHYRISTEGSLAAIDTLRQLTTTHEGAQPCCSDCACGGR